MSKCGHEHPITFILSPESTLFSFTKVYLKLYLPHTVLIMPSSDVSRKAGLKRKISSKLLSSSRKKTKVQQRSADDLPWKAVRIPTEAGLQGGEGVLELEEVEGIEVVYETTEGGRIAKFNVCDTNVMGGVMNLPFYRSSRMRVRKLRKILKTRKNVRLKLLKLQKMSPLSLKTCQSLTVSVSTHRIMFLCLISCPAEKLLPEWHKFPLHIKLKMALHRKGFLTPTAIQAASLPFTLANRDVIGVAQTVIGFHE